MKETAMVSVNPVICLVDWIFVQLFVHSSLFGRAKVYIFFHSVTISSDFFYFCREK